MTNTFINLYTSMLAELKQEFEQAEEAYVVLAKMVIQAVADKSIAADFGKEILAQDFKLGQCFDKLITNLKLIYREPIAIYEFSIQDNLLDGIKKRDKQYAELERIINLLAKQFDLPEHQTTEELIACRQVIFSESEFQQTCEEGTSESESKVEIVEMQSAMSEEKLCSQKKPVISSKRVSSSVGKKSASVQERPNILVCGNNAAGKTSLIREVTKFGTVPDSAINHYTNPEEEFKIYQTKIANFIDAGELPKDLQQVKSIFNSSKTLDSIQVIWFCYDGTEELTAELREIISYLNSSSLLVITKSDLMNKEETELKMNELCRLVEREKIVILSTGNRTGLSNLIDKTRHICLRYLSNPQEFTKRWNDYYAGKLNLWKSNSSTDADACINWAACRAAAIALIPLPVVDIAPLIANEMYMIYKLAEVYGIAIDKAAATSLLGCIGGSFAGKSLASFLPFLKAPIAAGVTYGVGKAVKAYFESGMTLSSNELKHIFAQEEAYAKSRKWDN